jgi:cytochrome c biogenesis protein
MKQISENKVYEIPLFPLQQNSKAWITWIEDRKEKYTIVIDQLENTFLIYDQDGKFIDIKTLGEYITKKIQLIDILPATGLLIKYDPSIPIIYIGFGLLMITSLLSYLPYTQLWILNKTKKIWVGGLTNRGKIQVEIEFENLIRSIEIELKKATL